MPIKHSNAKLLARLRQLENSIAEKDAQIDDAAARAVEAARYGKEIETATFWKVTYPLRWIATRWPQAVRRAVVNGAELTWLSLTIRLPRKLRPRRAPRPMRRREVQDHLRLPARSNSGGISTCNPAFECQTSRPSAATRTLYRREGRAN